jgi:hypothetical protein
MALLLLSQVSDEKIDMREREREQKQQQQNTKHIIIINFSFNNIIGGHLLLQG